MFSENKHPFQENKSDNEKNRVPDAIEDFEEDSDTEELEINEILPYSPFDAEEELKNIRKLSSDEKRLLSKEDQIELKAQRLENFKENLIKQKEGIARTIKELRDIVDAVPKTTTLALLSRVKTLAEEYRFTNEQIDFFKKAIDEYKKKNVAVEKYRTMYADDADLFEACFGKKPKGKIEILQSPMVLYFRCFDKNDYVFIYNFNKHLGDETKIEQKDIDLANKSSGCALSGGKITELSGTITAENVENVFKEEDSESIRDHEEQHQFNKLFKPVEWRETIVAIVERIIESGKTSEEATQQLIREYMRFERKFMGFDSSVRDEILAYYEDGRDIKSIYSILTESELYDYMKRYKKEIGKIPAAVKEQLAILKDVSFEKAQVDSKINPIDVSSVSDTMIDLDIVAVFKEEYKADLKKWLDSISKLEEKGYEIEGVVNLLSQEPVNSWVNLVKRMPSKIK